MRKAGLIIAAAGVTALFGAVAPAQAQSMKGRTAALPAAGASTSARDAYTLDQSQSRKVIELEGQQRWGLKLEMQQPVTRDMKLKDVEAGAYYKFTQAFRLGGAVGLADKKAPDEAPKAAPPAEKEQVAPRVKLGAIFKF